MLLSVSKETELILYAAPYTNTLLTKLFRIDKHSLMNVKCIFKWLFYKRYCHSKFIFLCDFLYVMFLPHDDFKTLKFDSHFFIFYRERKRIVVPNVTQDLRIEMVLSSTQN